MLTALGRLSVRHRWWVLLAWFLLLVGAAAAARTAGGSFTNDLTLAGTDSQAAYDTLRSRLPDMSGDGMQIVVHGRNGPLTPQEQQAVDAAVRRVGADAEVAAARSPFGPAPGRLVSADGRTAIVTVQFKDRAKDIPEAAVTRAQAAFEPVRALGVQVEYGGPAVQAESGPSGSEIYGLAAAIVVLLVAFGSLFAMVVPILTALMGVGAGLAGVTVLSGWVTIGPSGPVVAAMIGLGVGIDYALLIVTRHREGLAQGMEPGESVVHAMTTAGRAVLVAAMTVIVAILSLYLIGIPFVSALGLASSLTVASTLLASVTLLPALLAIFGTRIDALRVRRLRSGGRESRSRDEGRRTWVDVVQRHRWAVIAMTTGILILLALPLTSLRLGTADGGAQPTDTTQRRAYDLIAEDFGPGWAGPLLVTAEYGQGAGGPVQEQAQRLWKAIGSTEGVRQVTPPRIAPDGRTVVLTVVPQGSPDDASTERLVHRLRSGALENATEGARLHVGGATATSIDLADRLGARMGWFMLLVVGLAFLVLLVEFRALLVPTVAITMNLLAVGAAYGPVVAVFQWGWWPASLIGAQAGPVESFAPVMLFAVLFGLSTDYAVFLFSRIHEEYRHGGDARRAVRDGLAATARVILAAASVMVVVFSSFVLNDQRVVNLFGFGLATAIAVYALVAMLLLAPAVLTVLGRAAWWPARADRTTPGRSGTSTPPAQEVADVRETHI